MRLLPPCVRLPAPGKTVTVRTSVFGERARRAIVVLACALLACPAASSTAQAQGRESKSRILARKHKENYRLWKIRNELAQDDSSGRMTSTDYDTLGNKTREIITRGDSTVEQASNFRYDSTGQHLVEMLVNHPLDRQFPGTSRVTYSYNAGDDPVEIIQMAPDGTPIATSEFDYDSTGRVEKMRTKRGSTTVLQSFAMHYDAQGNVREAVGTDSAGRVTSRTVYTYDDSGNVLEQSSFTGAGRRINRLVFTYDSTGNVVTVRSYDADDSVVATTSNVYDTSGNIVETSNTTANAGSGMRTSLTHDAEGKLTEVVSTKPDGTVLRRVRYTYQKWP